MKGILAVKGRVPVPGKSVATRGKGHAYVPHDIDSQRIPGGMYIAGGTVDRRSVLRGDTIMHRTLCGTVGVWGVLPLWMVGAAPAVAQGYTFTKVADSARDGFDPFSFECSSINNKGDIAFRTARPAKFGPVILGVYR